MGALGGSGSRCSRSILSRSRPICSRNCLRCCASHALYLFLALVLAIHCTERDVPWPQSCGSVLSAIWDLRGCRERAFLHPSQVGVEHSLMVCDNLCRAS